MRNAILAKISGVSNCAVVTDEQLSAVTGLLYLGNSGITALAAGDFAGLTALTQLRLFGNDLTMLPAGVFAGMTSLTQLWLYANELDTLRAGVFNDLTSLTDLNLARNSLATLPAGVFDELTALMTLELSMNSLNTLPAGVFAGLTSLTTLALNGNPGAPFAPVAVALPDDGTVPAAGGTVTLDGSTSDGGPWGANVTYSWELTDPPSGVMFDDAMIATPVVTIPALAAGTELTFTLTVTGRGSAGSRSAGVALGTDTATVTVVDNTAPTVASIVRQDPTASPTDADELTWRVTFSEEVANVDAPDFEVTGTTATLTVTPVDNVTGAYDVTASAGNLGSLTGPVTLSFASGQDIGDASGNALANTMPTGTNEARYEVDNTVPIVISITRESPASSPTHADVLVWQVTFSEVVAKVDSADFEVTGTTATLTVAAVDPISPSQFDVTVEGGDLADLNATVTLAFAADHNIADPAGHELTTTDPTSTNDNTFELDNMAPTVTITGVPENSTASFTATITFTEPVTGFVMADITLTNATASNFTGADGDMVFTALITPSADGEVTVNVAADVATDAAGNGNTAAAQATSTYTAPLLDNTAPRLASIVRQNPTASPTDADELTWRVTFSEEVANVDAPDFTITGTTATLTVTPVTNETGAYDVTATAGDLAGLDATVTLAFAQAQDIADPANNALTNTTPTGANENTFVVDNTAPRLASIVRQNPTASPTDADELTWRVTFSEEVANVDAPDFTITGTTATLTVTPVTNETGAYDVTATAGDLAGLDATVTLAFAQAQDIADPANNALTNTTPSGANDNTFVLDNTAPTVASIARQAPTASPANADSLTWRVTFSEAVENVDTTDFTVTGTTATLTVAPVALVTGAYDVTAAGGNLGSLDATVTLAFDANQNIADAANNALANTMPSGANDNTFELDNTAPTVASIARQAPTASPANADSLTWRVTFSEAVENVDSVDFEVTGTTATLTATAVAGSSLAYDVTAAGGNLGSLDGTVTLAFAANQNIADAANNALANTTPNGANENTFELDNTAPTVTITGVPDMSSAAFTATITFTEPVTGFVLADITLTNATASNFTGADGETAFTALITPSANGAVTVDVAVDVAMDAAGNGNTAAVQASSLYDPNAGSCGRTAAVRNAILAKISGVSNCAVVTDEQLSAVTGLLYLGNSGITALAAGDFAGLTALTQLRLFGNDLTMLPAGVFAGMTSLTQLWLYVNDLDTLRAGVFDDLTSLTDLNLARNSLATLPAGVFDELTALMTLELSMNSLNTLPAGVFAGLTSLTTLALNGNPGAPFAPVAVALPDDGTVPAAGGTVTLDGSTSDGGPWGANVTYSWELTDPPSGVMFDDAMIATPVVTIPALAAGTELTFTLTVTGRGSAGSRSAGVALGTDTATVTVVDNTAPTVASIVRQDPTASPTNADVLTWRVTFSEEVANVDAPDFTITGTTATLTVTPVTNETGAYDVTASAGNLGSLTGPVTLSFASGQDIGDASGNALANTMPTGTNEASYVVDNTAPGVAISGVPDASTAPFTATITFTEGVAGFAVGDITVGNGTASAFTGSDGDTEFTALITPTADGAVTVDVAADVAMDAAGNGNTAATRVSSTYTAPPTDTVAPTVSSIMRQSPTSSPTNADVLTWRVTFSEAVANVDAADFTVAGTTATLTATAVSGSSAQYDVTVSGGNLAGLNATVTLAFVAGQNIQDAAGNALANTTPTGTNEASYVVDNIAPTVTISGVSPTSTAAFTVTITFSEGVNGFAVGDITVGNGTASAFTGSGGDTEFTALITPTADGAVTVDVAADVAMDTAGNGNTAAAQASSIYDNTAPTVASIMRQTPTSSPTNADVLTWRVTFSEAVANVDAADFAVSNTTATLTATAVSGSSLAYDVSASGGNLGSLDATVTLSFVAGQNIADRAGNALTNTAPTGANENAFVVDNTAPTVTITGVSPTSMAAFTVTITFSEGVNGFTVEDIAVGNGAASAFTGSGGDTEFTALITPTADGEVTVDVAADVAMDTAGNGNTAAAQASSIYDNTAPGVASIERQSPTSSPTNADVLTWRVTFSEAVANVDAADFTVAGTTATLTATAVSGSSAQYDVTVSGGNLAGLNATVTLSFVAGQNIQDAAGNALANTTPTGANEASYVVDNIAPTVTISGVSPTSTAAFTVTITFSEGVNGFAVGDITVGNGTASAFTGSGGDTEFTALITPTADGAVTVDVAADVATDAAGNGNTAATQASSIYDNTAPTVTITGVSATSTAAFTVTITFTEGLTNTAPTGANENGTAPTVTTPRWATSMAAFGRSPFTSVRRGLAFGWRGLQRRGAVTWTRRFGRDGNTAATR